MIFKDLNDLFKHIKNEVSLSMQTDVSEQVKEIESNMVQKDVYNAYRISDGMLQDPWEYQRRMYEGGLADTSNMHEVVEVVGNHVILSIQNDTMGKDQRNLYIAQLVEYGDNNGYGEYIYKTNRDGTSYQYLQPRPFNEDTIRYLEDSGLHIETLIRSLKYKGFVL